MSESAWERRPVAIVTIGVAGNFLVMDADEERAGGFTFIPGAEG